MYKPKLILNDFMNKRLWLDFVVMIFLSFVQNSPSILYSLCPLPLPLFLAFQVYNRPMLPLYRKIPWKGPLRNILKGRHQQKEMGQFIFLIILILSLPFYVPWRRLAKRIVTDYTSWSIDPKDFGNFIICRHSAHRLDEFISQTWNKANEHSYTNETLDALQH